MNTEHRNCQNCKKDFTIEPDDFSFYEKVGVPVPTLCPHCRRIRRLAWRNDFYLHTRDCGLCHNKFLSIYGPDSPITVFCPKCFWSDNWDVYEYGVDYDPSRSFIDQCLGLFERVPHLGIINDNGIASINCTYTQDVAFSKNCTMVFIGWKMENIMYSAQLLEGRDLCDCLGVYDNCNFTYDGVMIENTANCKSVYWCSGCADCILCYDCRGCTDCFMSSGLRNKKYYFKNQKLTKEEYEAALRSYALETRSGYARAKQEFNDFLKDKPRKFAELRNCVNATGADMVRCKNTKNSSFVSQSEDSRYLDGGVAFKQCYDCLVGGETECAYECITPDQSYMSLATIYSWKNNTVAYSSDCHSSANLLGCAGLKKGEYSILNKRYTKEEYHVLRERIILDMKQRGEWGEFFPIEKSFFGFNETRAIEQEPIDREEALRRGYKWQDVLQETRGKETMSQQKVPDSIHDVSDAIGNEILACVTCSRNYRILPDELIFYRRMHIPIPEECFFCRQTGREKMRGGYDLVHRQCDCSTGRVSMDGTRHDPAVSHNHSERCENSFQTVFTDKEPRPIYCEECYQKETI